MENHKYMNKHIDLQSQAIYVDNFFFKKSLHILEDTPSVVQIGILNMEFLEDCLKCNTIT
jgi:hypothetical protein